MPMTKGRTSIKPIPILCRMRYTAHFDKRSCVPALLSALNPNLMRIIDTWGKRPRVTALLSSSPIFFLVRQPKGALVFDSQGEYVNEFKIMCNDHQ